MNYSDGPWVIFQPCDILKQSNRSSYRQHLQCSIAQFIGIWSAYILPVITALTVIFYLLICVSITLKGSQVSKQLIYISGVCLFSSISNSVFVWLRQFPSVGLPYATNQKAYFTFIFISPSACRLYRFVYTFSCTAMCNMRVCASLCRCLAVCTPIKYKSCSNRLAWYIYGMIILFSALLMLPLAIYADWFANNGQIRCWYNPHNVGLQIYQALLSNLGPVQNILLISLDLTFLIKIRQHKHGASMIKLTQVERKQLKISILLLISSVTFICIAVPHSVFYFLDKIYILKSHGRRADSFRFIAQVLWFINNIRELSDIVIYLVCFKASEHIFEHFSFMYEKILGGFKVLFNKMYGLFVFCRSILEREGEDASKH
ncbi:unnamed protein product [Trichobilharzia regenti]|nr:unnamed protein product [Trichobilharzia regenti]